MVVVFEDVVVLIELYWVIYLYALFWFIHDALFKDVWQAKTARIDRRWWYVLISNTFFVLFDDHLIF